MNLEQHVIKQQIKLKKLFLFLYYTYELFESHRQNLTNVERTDVLLTRTDKLNSRQSENRYFSNQDIFINHVLLHYVQVTIKSIFKQYYFHQLLSS